jgi:hypothetical protein
MRPGPGWTNCGGPPSDPHGPVWDHTSGIRLHVCGMVRLAGGLIVQGERWPESKELYRFIRINGGNRKRGAMAWALAVAKR